MELNKKHLGSRIFIKALAREVEVCEENKLILLQHNFRHLFDLNKPVKTLISDKPESKKSKKASSKKTTQKGEDDSTESTES